MYSDSHHAWGTSLAPLTRLVYAVLLSRRDPEGYAYPSNATLKNDTGMGLSSIYRALNELEEAGLVIKTRVEWRHGRVFFVRSESENSPTGNPNFPQGEKKFPQGEQNIKGNVTVELNTAGDPAGGPLKKKKPPTPMPKGGSVDELMAFAKKRAAEHQKSKPINPDSVKANLIRFQSAFANRMGYPAKIEKGKSQGQMKHLLTAMKEQGAAPEDLQYLIEHWDDIRAIALEKSNHSPLWGTPELWVLLKHAPLLLSAMADHKQEQLSVKNGSQHKVVDEPVQSTANSKKPDEIDIVVVDDGPLDFD